MGSTFLSLHYHIVFSTKERCPFLRETWRSKMHEYLGGTVRGLGGVPETIGGVADHVHLLVGCDPQFGIHRLVRLIKGRSSRLLRQEFPHLRSRLPTLWTNSYFVATCGGAPLAIIKQYIERQKDV